MAQVMKPKKLLRDLRALQVDVRLARRIVKRFASSADRRQHSRFADDAWQCLLMRILANPHRANSPRWLVVNAFNDAKKHIKGAAWRATRLRRRNIDPATYVARRYLDVRRYNSDLAANRARAKERLTESAWVKANRAYSLRANEQAETDEQRSARIEAIRRSAEAELARLDQIVVDGNNADYRQYRRSPVRCRDRRAVDLSTVYTDATIRIVDEITSDDKPAKRRIFASWSVNGLATQVELKNHPAKQFVQSTHREFRYSVDCPGNGWAECSELYSARIPDVPGIDDDWTIVDSCGRTCTIGALKTRPRTWYRDIVVTGQSPAYSEWTGVEERYADERVPFVETQTEFRRFANASDSSALRPRMIKRRVRKGEKGPAYLVKTSRRTGRTILVEQKATYSADEMDSLMSRLAFEEIREVVQMGASNDEY